MWGRTVQGLGLHLAAGLEGAGSKGSRGSATARGGLRIRLDHQTGRLGHGHGEGSDLHGGGLDGLNGAKMPVCGRGTGSKGAQS